MCGTLIAIAHIFHPELMKDTICDLFVYVSYTPSHLTIILKSKIVKPTSDLVEQGRLSKWIFWCNACRFIL